MTPGLDVHFAAVARLVGDSTSEILILKSESQERNRTNVSCRAATNDFTRKQDRGKKQIKETGNFQYFTLRMPTIYQT